MNLPARPFRALAHTVLLLSFATFGALLAGVGCSSTQERPRDPWVFRSVLDERPRVVTVALTRDLWVAYDLTHCTLFKAWKGGVEFEGAVYTHEHGPQPRSVGVEYEANDPDRTVWSLWRGETTVPVEARYRGYTIRDGQVGIHYELHSEGGDPIRVTETPEFRAGPNGEPGWRRDFLLEGVPDDCEVRLEIPFQSLAGLGNIPSSVLASERRLDLTDLSDRAHDWGKTIAAQGSLRLSSTDVTTVMTWYPIEMAEQVESIAGLDTAVVDTVDAEIAFAADSREVSQDVVLEIPLILAAPVIDGSAEPLWGAIPAQPLTKLAFGIIQNPDDLSATFRLAYDSEFLYGLFEVQDDRIVNDSAASFNDDSVELYIDGGNEKGNFYDRNDAQYIFGANATELAFSSPVANHPGVEWQTRSMLGGYRIELRLPWANLDVKPEPGLEIGLEAHVDDDDDGAEMDAALAWFSPASDAWSDPGRFATAVLGGDKDRATPAKVTVPTEPGLAFRGFQVGRSMAELVRLVPGQTPNVSKVIPQLDLKSSADFGGLKQNFLAEVTGFLDVPAPGGDYEFRLTADDGARLWIDHRPVVGLDAQTPQGTGRLSLVEGQHGVRCLFYQDVDVVQLTLEWRGPGETEFTIIPAERWSTRASEVRVTSPGTKRILEPRSRLRPGDTLPLDGAHPSFDLSSARPVGFRPRVGGLDFLSDGRMVVVTWDPVGAVYLLDGVSDGDRDSIEVKTFATGLAEPLGVAVVDDEIYVLQKQELTQLIDHDGDDVADEYRVVAAGWGVTANFHEFAFGLVYQDEHFYGTLATAIKPGGNSYSPQVWDRGRAIRISRDGTYDFIAGGLRTPNGIGVGPNSDLFIADNQGDWLPASKLVHLREGAFFGNRSVDPENQNALEESPPAVWLPQGEIGNSPGEPILLRDGPYAGQMALCEVTHGGLKRIYLEELNGQYQGAVFRFSQGFEGGLNRVTYGPDGALYVGGIGSTGNWGQAGKERFGLERFAYNGDPTFEMLRLRAKTNGLEIEFTEALPEGRGWDPIDYEIQQWRYEPTAEYGGPKIDEKVLEVTSATVSGDRRRVFLEIVGLEVGHVVYLRLAGPFVSEQGRELWSTEAWYTLNWIPENLEGEVRPSPYERPANEISATEAAAGFRLLFDGESLEGWRPYQEGRSLDHWRVEDGAIHFDGGETEAQLATASDFESFELRLEWKVAPGGNSGVFFHVKDGLDYPWESGPEMQILDNRRHPDGRSPKTSAGANYALEGPPFDASRAAGLWNEARLIVRNGHVEHWLNGYRVVSYELGSQDWESVIAASKFKDMPNYGRSTRGRIVLQNHGDPVWFRSVRISTTP